MSNQAKWQLLVGLLLVWGAVTLMQVLDETEQSSSPGTALTVNASSEFWANPISSNMTLPKTFDNPREHIVLSQPRNIFSPLNFSPPRTKSPKSKRVSPKTMQPQPQIQPQVVVPTGPSPLELATQRAQQQLRQFRFLGYLKKGGEQQAFLTKGQAIYIVKQGATVEGNILVSRIQPTIIVLSTQVVGASSPIKAEIPLTKEG